MLWSLCAPPYVLELTVAVEEIDILGHANNAAYVSWLERCAWRHSEYLGLNFASYQRLDRAMAVVRHEIDYVASAYLEDQLQVATWIIEWDTRFKMTRHFEIVRPKDRKILLRARTAFACIELSTGKARRMPSEFIEGYGRALITQASPA